MKKEKTNQDKTAEITRNGKQKPDSENTNLDEVREFSENIIDTVREPLLALDQDLRVVKASRSFYEFFKTTSDETIGKLIYNLGNNQWDIPELRDLLETILPEKTTFDNLEVEHDFPTIGKRIMLLNARQIKRAFGKEKIILLAIEDITERMQLKELLTESEERYRRLFETADDGILLLDKSDGNITHANPAILEMLMFTKEECIGKNLKDIGFSLAGDDIKNILQKLDKSGIINYDDVLVQTKVGQAISTDIYMVDKASLVQCNIRDITERKQVENALIENEEKFRVITESSADAIFISDQQGKYIYVNYAASEMLGFTKEELADLTILDIAREEKRKETLELFSRLLKEGKMYVEMELKKKDGSFLPVDLNAVLLPNGMVYGSCRDISERKHAEEEIKASEKKYRKLIDDDLTGYYITSIDGKFLLCNPALVKLFGFGSVDELMAENISSFYKDPDSRKQLLNKVRENKKIELLEREFILRDGREISVIENIVGEFDKNGELVGLKGYIFDNTERKQAEKSLLILKKAVDNSGEAIFLTDKEGIFTFVNPAFVSIYGFTADEIVGKVTPRILKSGIVKANDYKLFWEKILSGKEVRGELYNKRKDGTLITIEGSNSPVFDEKKNIIGFLGIHRDVTERSKAEEALRTSESQLSNAMKIAKLAYWEYDVDADMFTFNDHFYDIYKTTAKKAGGYQISSEQYARQFVYPDDLSIFGSKIQEATETTDPDYSSQIEHRIIYANGEIGYVSVHLHVVKDNKGATVKVFGTNQDITERKQTEDALRKSEEKYRKFVESDLSGVYISTPDGRILFCNSAYVNIFGFNSMEEAMKCNINSLYPETRSRRAFLAELKRKKELKLHETEFLNCQGETINVLENVIGSFDQKGALVEIRGYLLDITETKKMEEQFRASQKMEAVGRLAGGVAHDFNNLLTVIDGYSELLINKLNDDNPIKKDIIQIQKAGERAGSLISQLLAFSRRQIIQPKVLNINTIITDIEKMLHRLIGEDIELVTMLDKELGNIKADRGQMDQVIMNLAVNARDAMPEGGKLTIETSNIYLSEDYIEHHISVQPGKYIMLAISDTGLGMDSETKSKIFDPFFTTKGIGKGTGLGLSTVYGIVKQNGGNIWVYSEPGKGTTFKIYLPVVEEKTSADVPFKPSFDSIKGSETILLVEDDYGVRELSHSFLTRYGYKVFVAENGEKALQFCKQYKETIHLMITDVVMPQMSGRVLAENLVAFRPEIKVLYVSGYTDDSIVHHGVLDPDVAFLAKPFSPVALAKKVREVLDTSKLSNKH